MKNDSLIPSSRYPAKILLFGEYSVLRGSEALACPFQLKCGHLKYACFSGSSSPGPKKSQESLVKLFIHLSSNILEINTKVPFDINGFRNDLISGLFFESDIPENYGIGSSGALIAAIYDTYADKSIEIHLDTLIQVLGFMESYFHEKSSGMDPLVSLLSKAIHLKNSSPREVPFTLEKLKKYYGIYLIDSGQAYATKKGMNQIQQNLLSDEYILLNNQIIQLVLAHDYTGLFHKLLTLCVLQLEFFKELFPTQIQELCQEGLSSQEYAIKLCGSGGGGYFLLFTAKPGYIPKAIESSGLSIIPL